VEVTVQAQLRRMLFIDPKAMMQPTWGAIGQHQQRALRKKLPPNLSECWRFPRWQRPHHSCKKLFKAPLGKLSVVDRRPGVI